MIVFIAALGVLSTGISSYYIYSYHKQHFKETMFLKSVELYSNAKLKYKEYVANPPIEVVDDLIKINDVKILRNNEIINFDPESYYFLNWEKLGKNSLLHVVYEYQDNTYRIVFSYGENLNLITTELQWLRDGFYNGIETVDSNLINPDLRELLIAYSGPLGDFYQDAGLKNSSLGFLDMDFSQKLLQGELKQGQYNPKITITNILGETLHFGVSLEKIE